MERGPELAGRNRNPLSGCGRQTGKKRLPGRNDAADGVAAGQQDAATVGLTGWSVRRVETWARLGDQFAAAGWAHDQLRLFGDLGVALLAELVHMEKTTPARRVDRGFIVICPRPGRL